MALRAGVEGKIERSHVASPTFPQCWHPAAEAQHPWSLPSVLKQDVWFEDEFHKVSWALLGEIYKAKINNESGEGAKTVCWTDGGWAFQGKDCFLRWFFLQDMNDNSLEDGRVIRLFE